MEFLITSALIGVGLAMDCFAVSLAVGATRPGDRLKAALLLAGFFGFFQFGMTLIGWGLGFSFADLIAAYDHWVAFLLLAAIGGRMLYEGLKGGEEVPAALTLASITLLAVATSIDALAVGISFAFLGYLPLAPALIIGAISVGFSFVGVFSGRRLERLLGARVNILGGIILILIGLRILLEHTVFA
jgi:manganese efflux pump family protein